MGKALFLLVIFFCALETNAQNYLITFTGEGAFSSVNSVKIENLTAGSAPLTIDGSDILHLTGTTDIYPVENRQSSVLKIFPNPSEGIAKLQVYPPLQGDAVITLFDITGKQVTQIQSYLNKSLQEFQLSGLNNGFYLVSIKGINYRCSGKLLSNSYAVGAVNIEYISSNQAVEPIRFNKDDKGSPATVDMSYSMGDRLKFTGTSGNYSAVKTDIPAGDKTITFNFITCTDADNNNYPVVEIGTQVWMAENLKTTRYRDGTEIPNVTDNTAWGKLTTGAYSDYDNASGYGATYGKLYNWPAAVDSRNLCPTGWRIPTHDEWLTLNTYLGNGLIAGSKIKETGTINWSPPNSDATNETGFTALPGGSRSGINGTFSNIKNAGYWLSATAIDDLNSYGACVVYNFGYVATVKGIKQNGFSVRCLKN